MNYELTMTVIVLLLIFVILREFFCWYWKQNEILRTLQSIDKRLEANPRVASHPGTVPLGTKCPKCGRRVDGPSQKVAGNGLTQCPECNHYFKV